LSHARSALAAVTNIAWLEEYDPRLLERPLKCLKRACPRIGSAALDITVGDRPTSRLGPGMAIIKAAGRPVAPSGHKKKPYQFAGAHLAGCARRLFGPDVATALRQWGTDRHHFT